FISLRDNPNRGGYHKIYNNTFVTPVANGQVAAILEDDPRLPSPNLSVRNNIFSGFQWPFDIRSVNDTFDFNNLHFTRNVGKWGGSWVETFSDWQKLGNDLHGISADPQFVSSSDFHLRPGSPCIDRGAILEEPYTIDLDGEKRPQGTSFDLGAFEVSKQTALIRKNRMEVIPGYTGSALFAAGTRVFDLKGRPVTSANTGRAARHRLLVVLPRGKQASIRPVVQR
ncbi:MAG: hypothetical protein JXA71_18830, partial [Chitinispirillaceae bacterium]|nr:hypothetical protein [Chitinispirillaceae bacterium]